MLQMRCAVFSFTVTPWLTIVSYPRDTYNTAINRRSNTANQGAIIYREHPVFEKSGSENAKIWRCMDFTEPLF